jgi:hypothetical protein
MPDERRQARRVYCAPLLSLALLTGCGSDSATNVGTDAAVAFGIASMGQDLTSIAVGQFESLLRSSTGLSRNGDITALASETETVSCTSGQIVITRDDKNGNGLLDAGETAALEFQDCVQNDARLSGSMTIAVNALTRNYGRVEAADVSFTFDNFVAANQGDNPTSTAFFGDMAMQADSIYATPLDASISGNRLVRVAGGSTYTLTNYSGRLIHAEGLVNTLGGLYCTGCPAYEYRIAGTATGGDLPGPVTLATLEPMRGVLGFYPQEGQIKVVRATDTGTSALLIEPYEGSLDIQQLVNDCNRVYVYLDASGTGTFKFYDSYLWDEFLAQLPFRPLKPAQDAISSFLRAMGLSLSDSQAACIGAK